jgi:hypothetical protein
MRKRMLPIGKEIQHLSRHYDATLIHSKTIVKERNNGVRNAAFEYLQHKQKCKNLIIK